ncbi:MAG: amidohydrolase family protein [Gammaproteobacteria bacterium]|nr:amidohydrolase family protein [Gammaproteobacteria bacterium]
MSFAGAQDKDPHQTLFINVHVFYGLNEERLENANVLVDGNLIKEVSAGTNAPGASVIDGGGRTLMPGIIEAHGHPGLPVPPSQMIGDVDWMLIGAAAVEDAKTYIDHGWTTVRDTGGPSYGIKKAIDEGLVPGPRIYPSGMMISQTSGHGDFRRYADSHPNSTSELPFWNKYFAHIADGLPEVRRAVREELRKGAVHIKLMAGGGVTSLFDPLHTTQYSLEEMQAAVEAAEDWGTYVMVHAYTDRAVSRAVEAGVKAIEHGQLATEDTAKLMAENGVWLSTQAWAAASDTAGELMEAEGPITYGKWQTVNEGFEASLRYAEQYGIKVAFGTDMWGDATPNIAQEFIARQPYFSNIDILRQATSINGELMQLTGSLNPYPEGPLGVIQPGAYADILLIDGNPIEDLEIMTYTDRVDLVMKDGVIYKNTVE